jgi:hypothetical protein
MKVMRASFTATCKLCRGKITPGQQIIRAPGKRWAHVGCIIRRAQALGKAGPGMVRKAPASGGPP